MKKLLVLTAILLASPALAQDLGAPVPTVAPVEAVGEASEDDEGGLTGSVSYEGRLDDLGIAIPGFATDVDKPTGANAYGTGALGRELGRVVLIGDQRGGLGCRRSGRGGAAGLAEQMRNWRSNSSTPLSMDSINRR